MSIFDKLVQQIVQGATNITHDAVDQVSDIVKPSQPEQQEASQEPSYYYSNTTAQSSGSNIAPQSNTQTNPVSVVVDESQPLEIDEQQQGAQHNVDNALTPLIEGSNEFDESYQGSPQQLADIQAQLKKEEDERLDMAKQFDYLNTLAAYGQLGMSPNDQLVQNALSDIDNGNVSNFSREQARRLGDEHGNPKADPLDWNIFGFTSQNKTAGAAKDLYDYMFAKEEQALRDDPQAWANAARQRRNRIENSNGVVGIDDIDDGTPDGREALYMTGERYLQYRNEYGLPGRDVEDINPNEIYSKQDEQDLYGFIPYLQSDEAMDKFHNDASAQLVNNAFSNLANFRRNITDYDVNFEGEKYSGRDLMKNVANWSARTQDQWQDPNRLVTDKSKANEWSIPQAIEITFSDGSTERVYGEPRGYTDEENGQLVWIMPDGASYRFEDMDDFNNSVRYVPANDGDYVVAWQNIDPLELDDGRMIRADKVNYLMSTNDDTGQKNLEQYADYGYWGKPYVSNPIEEGRWLPWLVDMALGSAPLFYSPTAGTQAVGNAWTSNTGFKPGSDDYLNGTYSMLSDNPTEEQRSSAVLGSLALPLTERLWGNLGAAAFKGPLTKLATRGGRTEADIRPLARWGIEGLEEGMEEIPGNIVEEFQRGSGLSDFYANDLYIDADGNYTTDEYDADGNRNRLAMDSQGYVAKAPTDFTGRMRNFIEDIPLSFLGGAALGGSLGVGNIPGYRNEYNTRKAERALYGDNLVVPDFNQAVIDNNSKLTDEERDFYNS